MFNKANNLEVGTGTFRSHALSSPGTKRPHSDSVNIRSITSVCAGWYC